MTNSYKKRANAGATISEKRNEEATPEKHGNKKPRVIRQPEWVKLCCASCGFLMGYRMDSPWFCKNSFGHQCLGCNRKAKARS